MTGRTPFIAILIVCGVFWGLSVPLASIAVSDGYRHFGLIFWQTAIAGTAITLVCAARGRLPRIGWRQLPICLTVALAGNIFPGIAFYQSAAHLPAGIVALLVSLVPMFSFPMALALGTEKFAGTRLAGLLLGALAVLLLAAPDAALPDPSLSAWVLVAMIAPFFYALEGNMVDKFGTAGLDPVQLLCASCWIGAVIALPLALATGQFIDPRPPWGPPDLAVLLSSLISILAYSAYVWLVRRAGAVFAAQVAYLITGGGVIWSILLLSERYPPIVWAAMALMLAGILLVQPRQAEPLPPDPTPT
ncbi:DMT family transporter [Pseudoruegeria sp. HB172150]|uniref:DMT family transporter n=1 Tax=Pseudoruegeria sp. HB172150 TaxID=2721164 RepID=UPI0015570EDB|nr:DMT family transporter [Pseudoruegeria sp. HB172150]